jgi:hypothetical protein
MVAMVNGCNRTYHYDVVGPTSGEVVEEARKISFRAESFR